MEPQISKRKIIIGIGGVILLALLFLITLLSQLRSSTTRSEVPIPTPVPLNTQQLNTPQITSLPRQTGSPNAIDTGAPVVENSQTEIQKLYPFLPYTYDVTLQNGIALSIVIPAKELQDDPWKLTAQIFGVNYQVLPQEADYQIQKEAFLTGANVIFSWMRSHHVDPTKVIIKWGNQAFIQKRAEEWLSS